MQRIVSTPCRRSLRAWLHFGCRAVLMVSVLAAVVRAAVAAPEIESIPFATPPPRGEQRLFTELPAEATGIVAPNPYDDPAMWGEQFERFAFGSMGTGVAIGDYDGDGRPDLYVSCRTARNHLFRNLGGWRFADVTDAAGVATPPGAWKTGVAFADVNNDGRLDLYVCRIGAPNLLYISRGDGTFTEEAAARGVAVADANVMGAFCDYDRDGWLDLYVVTNLLDYAGHPDGQQDHLFHNRGDGTFEEVTRAAGLFGQGQKHAALWCDYDGDGWPDVYVTYDYGWPDQLLRNNHDGTFTNQLAAAVPHVPRFSMGADFGDVNNDGLIDLLVPDMLPTTRERDQRAMIDARAHISDLPDPAMTPQYMRNALFLNTGLGRYQEAGFLAGVAATDWTWSPRLEDLDNDGRLDLFVTNGTIREFFDVDLRRRSENLSPAERRRIFRNSPVLREHNLAFHNRGDLQFEEVGAAWGLDHLGVSFGTAFGDLDGDGDLDLVFTNYDGNVTVCRNNSDYGHRLIVSLRGSASNRFGIGAVVHLDTASGPQVRQLAVARGYMSSSEPAAHFGLGEISRVDRLTVRWPDGREQVFNDLPADRHYTLHEPSSAFATAAATEDAAPSTAQFVEVAQPLGLDLVQPESPVDELAEQPLLPLRQNTVGPGVAIADINGDRLDDIVIGGTAGHAAKVLIAQPDGTYAARPEPALAAAAVPDAAPLLIDVDGDGRPDLFLARGGVGRPADDVAYQPQLYLNRDGTRFEPAPATWLPRCPTSAGPVVAADFNRDGRLDIFIGGRVVPGAYPTAPRSVLLANDGTAFRDVTEAQAPGLSRVGMVEGALWSDVDGDGWPDLLLALHWGGIRCWRNVRGEHFEDVSAALGFAAAGAGWWNSLAAADFNGDGQPDYAVGNVGLNTPYQPGPDKPVVLLRGVFGDGESPQLLEANYDAGRLVPVRGRSTMDRVFAWMPRKFPTFRRYAAASLDEIFGRDRLGAAARFEATEFRSGVFLSQPDHTFRFQPLPRLAQIAPIYGLAAGDFDGDGRADLYAVQNSYAPIPEVGRFDGGLSQFLRGDGHGGFLPVPPAETHLVVPGDAKALAMLDVDRDGWPEFLVTRAGDRVLVFGNGGRPGRQVLAVRLRGPAGNLPAFGARVTAILADGTTQTGEVSAGSGYLAQSAPACFFGHRDDVPIGWIRVRWPSGAVSEIAVPPHATALVVSEPR